MNLISDRLLKCFEKEFYPNKFKIGDYDFEHRGYPITMTSEDGSIQGRGLIYDKKSIRRTIELLNRYVNKKKNKED